MELVSTLPSELIIKKVVPELGVNESNFNDPLTLADPSTSKVVVGVNEPFVLIPTCENETKLISIKSSVRIFFICLVNFYNFKGLYFIILASQFNSVLTRS